MNRSYSKIRHIQESNLKLEKRRLNEDETLDDIFNKLKNDGFDSLDFHEKSVLDDYQKYIESGKNDIKYSSPKKGYQMGNAFKHLNNTISGNGNSIIGNDPVYKTHDENIGHEDDYIATFDGKMIFNINDVPRNYDLNQYEKIGCFKTLEEFSMKFPVWCYKAFKYYNPKLFTKSTGLNKSSDYPEWWWKLQDFSELSSPFRQMDLEKGDYSQKLFSAWLKTSRLGCLEIYKKKNNPTH